MKTVFRQKLAITFLLAAFAAGVVTVARAQDTKGETGERRPPKGSNTEPGSKSHKSAQKVYTAPKSAHPTPTTGTLTVTAESNAVITIEAALGGKALEGTVPQNQDFFIFEKLPQGTYNVTATLDGYAPAQKQVNVVKNRTAGLTLDLKRITHTITINTNINAGDVSYQAGTEPPRTVKIQGDKRAVLPDLLPGRYTIEIQPEDYSYEKLRIPIDVPDARGDIHNLPLRRYPSAEDFSLNAGELSLPDGWRIEKRKILVNGSGMALPKEEKYHYYQDFQLNANVKMANEVAVSFVLRARDQQNYYLIQFTGEKNAEQPYVLRSFVVKDGNRRSSGNIYPIRNIADSLQQNKFFEVAVTMKGFKITVEVRQDGELQPVGIFEDLNKTFPVGAVGIAASDKERNEIGSFLICASVCRNQ
jgi:hypothetical protein